MKPTNLFCPLCLLLASALLTSLAPRTSFAQAKPKPGASASMAKRLDFDLGAGKATVASDVEIIVAGFRLTWAARRGG